MKLILCAITSLWSFFSFAQWQDWNSSEAAINANGHWAVSVKNEGIEFKPVQRDPRILIIMPRKASLNHIALQALLDMYSRELPRTQILVKKLPAASSAAALQQALKSLLLSSEDDIDLIYSVGSAVTVALRHAYKGGRIPVVSVHAKDPVQLGLLDSYQGSGDNFAFTSLNLPANVTLSFMKQFKPSLQQIGVLYAKKNQSSYLTQYLPLKEISEKEGINVIGISVDESDPDSSLEVVMERTIQILEKADPRLDNSLLWLTGSSSLLSRMSDINAYARGLAVTSAVPDVVKQGQDSALISFGVSYMNNAHQAGLYGLKILQDNLKPGNLPVGQVSPPDISISFEQAQRLNQKIPFVLMEMASKIYDTEGQLIRSDGQFMQEK